MKHSLEMAKTIEDATQRQSVVIHARLGMEYILGYYSLNTKHQNMEMMELITTVVIQLVLVQKFGA